MAMPLATRRFTVEEYHRMAEAGVFHEDDRVELIDGQVVEMTPIGPRHARCVDDLTRLLTAVTGEAAIVRVQNPVVVGRHAEPYPDVSLLRPRPDRYGQEHPQPPDVLLIIEVADTTLRYDRETKVPLYAQAGISEVWLVNLPADSIEVYREPRGEGYTDVHTAQRGERLTPVQLRAVTLRVDDILG